MSRAPEVIVLHDEERPGGGLWIRLERHPSGSVWITLQDDDEGRSLTLLLAEADVRQAARFLAGPGPWEREMPG